ncbi:precorrin-6A reductase [uncultured Treponema sp.]|uniref:precorrin-6A reductase n=1 Tax=uncultured Treponema sp. TaxID=162155 RepID=UPI0025CBCCE9|nr:precorrin-6A reductase [uncultured Treponema sp.]
MNVFIFAGTTEGRSLAEIISKNKINCTVSAATEYGANLLPRGENIEILCGRMDCAQMAEKLEKKDYAFVIDATHPFADKASEEIKKACELTKTEYLRLARNTDCPSEVDALFDSLSEAAQWLEGKSGRIFVTTGSKELPLLAQKISDKNRIFARVLPTAESLEICMKAGIPQGQIIAMQGPFSEKMNEVQFEESGAEILLTKESGAAGGFYEKIDAAEKLGMKIVVIRNPEKHGDSENSSAHTVEEILEKIGIQNACSDLKGKASSAQKNRAISLVGIGMGNENLFTQKMRAILSEADIIFGAARILKSVENLKSGKCRLEERYEASKIADFLKNHPEFMRPVVVLSGDTGFFSGAPKFFEEEFFKDYEIQVESGISSPQYLASRLGKPWQKWKFLSLHGAKCNYIEEIRRNSACFFILSGADDLKMLGEKLELAVQNGILSSVKCYIGSNLSYDVEKIIQISLKEMQNFSGIKKSLHVLLVENENAVSEGGLPLLEDSDFTRTEEIPMTKKEIRQLTLCALGLSKSAVFYDIGSGTGSVSVEAARIAFEGQVYAVERKKDAFMLTKENVQKFCLENVTCIHAEASDFLDDEAVPSPTHAFIGGSGKNLSEIIRLLLKKNPSVRIAANFVSLEGFCEMQAILKNLEENHEICAPEIKQVSVNRVQRAGEFHLMKAQNPVWIVSFSGAQNG